MPNNTNINTTIGKEEEENMSVTEMEQKLAELKRLRAETEKQMEERENFIEKELEDAIEVYEESFPRLREESGAERELEDSDGSGKERREVSKTFETPVKIEYIPPSKNEEMPDKQILPSKISQVNNLTKEVNSEQQRTEPEPPTDWQKDRGDKSSQDSPDNLSNTKKDIEELRKRLKTMEEESQKTHSPHNQSKTETAIRSDILKKLPTEQTKKTEDVSPPKTVRPYGVAPAKDLGTGDFEWQGKIGGVEIERTSPEDEKEEVIPDRAKVLEEIEYPPPYVPKTSLDDKLSKRDETLTHINTSSPSQNREKTDESKNSYRDSDPYREPIE